jgi:hypothetical protein
VKNAQVALKQMKLFSADVNGIAGPQTRAAVKEFQMRHGIKPTGELDAKTLQRIQRTIAAVATPPPAQAQKNQKSAAVSVASPNATISARERAIQLIQSDQDFLKQIESMNRAPAPSPTAAIKPPERVAAAPVAEQVKRLPPRQLKPQQSKEPSVTLDDARRFVERYMQLAEGSDPEDEASCYGDNVDYFSEGKVPHQYVQDDQGIFYKRWPTRQFSIVGTPEVIATRPEATTVRFRVRYDLRSQRESSKGEADGVMRIARTPKGFKILAIRERKIPAQ